MNIAVCFCCWDEIRENVGPKQQLKSQSSSLSFRLSAFLKHNANVSLIEAGINIEFAVAVASTTHSLEFMPIPFSCHCTCNTNNKKKACHERERHHRSLWNREAGTWSGLGTRLAIASTDERGFCKFLSRGDRKTPPSCRPIHLCKTGQACFEWFGWRR